MYFKKSLNLMQEIGNIMYVGGILSHIVIGIILGHEDTNTAIHVYIYKSQSADILILPGLALKISSDLILYFTDKQKPNWLKLKLAMNAFLATNAFIFLVPMMPELLQLANDSSPNEHVSQAFLDKVQIEMYIGMSNVIPLILELTLGSFKPKIGKREKQYASESASEQTKLTTKV